MHHDLKSKFYATLFSFPIGLTNKINVFVTSSIQESRVNTVHAILFTLNNLLKRFNTE